MTNKNRIKAGIAILAVASTIGITSYMMSYAVKINGETVGTTRNLYAIREAVTKTEERLTDTLGYEYSIDTEVMPVFATQVMDAQELEEEIIHSIPDVELLWVINVNGEIVGACGTKEEADTILSGIMDKYITESTVTVEFLQEVTVTEAYVSCDTLKDTDEITRLLTEILSVHTTAEETEHRVIPCDVEYYDTSELYEGEYQVTRDGTDMEQMVTVSVDYLNGNEILRTEIASETIVEAVSQQVARGTTERPPTASYGVYIWPAEGVISSDFGYRTVSVGSSDHKGIDIAGEADSDIVAADGGEVIFAGDGGGYGNLVKIRHDNGAVTYYGHCSSLAVSEGERVARGQVIAYMGTTGVSTGVHLHFEVRVDDIAQDPMNYLP